MGQGRYSSRSTSRQGLVLGLLLLLLAALSGCTERKPAQRELAQEHSPAHLLDHAPGALPANPEAILDALSSDALRLAEVKDINGTVMRLTFTLEGRRLRAKWKPLGPGGSEEQDGFDGNNAPRCEVAAWRVDRLLFGPTTARSLVPPVVVRAFHRDVPCTQACAHLPRLSGLDMAPTFPELNEHLVLGALSWWLDGVAPLEHFHGGLWDAQRFASNPEYRRSFSDLVLFLHLIQHGDANYAPNFLVRTPALDRLYSIDNGRAFDGISYYTGEGDPDWAPFAQLAPERLVAPAFSQETLSRLSQLEEPLLRRELRIVAAIDMRSGRTVREPAAELPLAALVGEPLEQAPALTRRGRGLFTGQLAGRPWVLFGIGEQGIADTAARARALVQHLEGAVFDGEAKRGAHLSPAAPSGPDAGPPSRTRTAPRAAPPQR